VLTPVRELAFQIADQLKALGEPVRARVEVVVGGQPGLQQQNALRARPHIVVGTPGRIAELLEGQDVRRCFRHLKMLIFDEADRMLEACFQPALELEKFKIEFRSFWSPEGVCETKNES